MRPAAFRIWPANVSGHSRELLPGCRLPCMLLHSQKRQHNFSSLAQTYADGAPIPQGYTRVFQDQFASTSAPGYLGLYTLTSYDTIKCQQLCDTAPSCYAFNVYYERDPTLEPADACPNPPSTINIKCTLWGTQISKDTATNSGQTRNQFRVVINGSNGM